MIHQLTQTQKADWKERLKVGQYNYLLIRVTGTNDTAQTAAASDIGDFYLERNGMRLVDISTEFLNELNDQLFGQPEEDSTTAGAFSFTFILPFELPDFPSAFHVRGSDNVYLGYRYGSNMDTRLGANSMTIEVSGHHSDNPENYFPAINLLEESIAGAVTRHFLTVPDQNIQF